MMKPEMTKKISTPMPQSMMAMFSGGRPVCAGDGGRFVQAVTEHHQAGGDGAQNLDRA